MPEVGNDNNDAVEAPDFVAVHESVPDVVDGARSQQRVAVG